MRLNVLFRRAVAALALVAALAGSPGLVLSALEHAPGWRFEITNAQFPDTSGEAIQFDAIATNDTDAAAEVTYDISLLLPDGEDARLGVASPSYSHGMKGGYLSQTITWDHAEAGPYVARIVWLDGDREVVVAEAHGWVGSADAPVVVLDSLQTDPTTPKVGEQTTVEVTMTNQGQTTGSRSVQVSVWLDGQTYEPIGTVRIRDIDPGQTKTGSFSWAPNEVVTATKLGAGIPYLTRGLVLAPFSVVSPDDGAAADGN